MLVKIACVMVGGAAGAVLRFLSVEFAARRFGLAAYRSIFLINLLGCLALGFFVGSLSSPDGMLAGFITRWAPDQPELPASWLASLVGTGLLGGFTTFSTFALDSLVLAREKRRAEFFIDVLGTPALGIGLAAIGWALAARGLA